ncbi:AIPR family protein [Paenibacillus odorifer]|uniref:AIPR family protein n=1 Tax=Paenibacillus TaxID=44249 RepID=UPI00096D8187|nr:AIPR family protein [Paenibacillus odorifer]OME30917.1 AIPR protein [Paenibacillus odorifer]OME31231.1 AIPR protein [Paenibacillus odorifer]
MELQEFRKELLEDVRSSAATFGEGSSAAFVGIVANYLVNAEVLPDFEPAFYIGSGMYNRKLRIDGYALDEFDYTMNLIVANYTNDEKVKTLTRSEAQQIFEWPIRFLDETYHNKLLEKIEISSSAADLIDILLTNKEKIRKFRILLFSDGNMSGRIESFPVRDFDGVSIEFQIWDIERLYKMFLADSGRENIEVDFTQYSEKGIPCLDTSNYGDNPYDCYLGVISGTVLADVYDRYGAQLLEGNVRSFLSTKVAVNKKIRETIISSPQMFFAFNNGISATAVDVIIEDRLEGKFITSVKDFQIINGGQTTASLSNARYKDKADLSTVSLQMKLTVINADLDETHNLMQKISRSSNSQNKVSDADFFSTHPFHIRMEQISRRIFAPAVGGAQHDTHWFYERARGQYLQAQMRMTKAERNRFITQNPKHQLITKTDLAKARNSWRGLPHKVSKGAQSNFSEFAQWVDDEWSISDESFNERYFQESLALYILFKHVEKLVTHQEWYEQGYRANIVTYSISLMAHLIKKQYPNNTLDLQIIWSRQEIPGVLSDQMARIAKSVLDSITDPSRGMANVTQWCKREACWDRVKELDITLDANIQSVLIDIDNVKSEVRKARKDQRMVTGIEAQTRVVNYGADFWKKVQYYVAEKKIPYQAEAESLKIACQIPFKLPNSVHSQKLLELLNKAVAEGWKED